MEEDPVRNKKKIDFEHDDIEFNILSINENIDIENNFASNKKKNLFEEKPENIVKRVHLKEKQASNIENIDIEKNLASNVENIVIEENSLNMEDNRNRESVDEIRFLSLQKENFTSLLKIIKRTKDLYHSLINCYKSIQVHRTVSNQPLFLLFSRILMETHSSFENIKSGMLHIEDLFQCLDKIVKSTSDCLKSQFLNCARKLVHALENTERDIIGLLKTLRKLGHRIELNIMIIMNDPSLMSALFNLQRFSL